MENEIDKTLNFLELISDKIHYFIADHISNFWLWQVIAKLIFLVILIFTIDFILKSLINFIFSRFKDPKKFPFLKSVYESKVTNSVAHLFAVLIGSVALYSIFWRHKQSFTFLERFLDLVAVLILTNMAYRFLNGIKYYYSFKNDFYRLVAINAISQTLKTVGVFIFTVISVSVIFGIGGSTILGSLGAITAVLVLVFRDTILGFMTGIHVATSRSLKVGDWIGIPKYNLEGTIQEINIITTKILNFDKTISTIPTYDLLSTEIKNLQVMSESNTRRIKRPIIFNINSFKFLSLEKMDELSKINLIKDYLNIKKEEIISQRQNLDNPDLLINGRQLTNIGVFREYAFNYLKNNPHIDQEGTLLVRQMENTPQGMPLEIYCFTNDSAWANYEDIQADIFDHLLVASKEFDLEIMQVNKI